MSFADWTPPSTAQCDAAHVKPLTKAEMVAFCKEHFHPASKTRARISVHLHARGSAKESGAEAPAPAGDAEKPQVVEDGIVDAVATAVEIVDGHRHKAGLVASRAAQPVKDLKEYEELGAKL